MKIEIVILSGASCSHIARGAVEEPALSLSKGPAVCWWRRDFLQLFAWSLLPVAHLRYALSYFAHAIPSASFPASITRETFHCPRSISATGFLALQATYAILPPGAMSTSVDPSGTSSDLRTF